MWFCSNNIYGQDSLQLKEKFHGCLIKYSVFNGAKVTKTVKNKDTFYALELGIARSYEMHAAESAGYSYYFSNEFVSDFNKFYIAPKIGANVSVWGFMVGSELACYTNFKGNSLHFIPYLGIGLGAGKLTAGFPIPIYNKNFLNTDYLNVSLTLPIITVKKKIIDNN